MAELNESSSDNDSQGKPKPHKQPFKATDLTFDYAGKAVKIEPPKLNASEQTELSKRIKL